mgnify:CR=1 FL=1
MTKKWPFLRSTIRVHIGRTKNTDFTQKSSNFDPFLGFTGKTLYGQGCQSDQKRQKMTKKVPFLGVIMGVYTGEAKMSILGSKIAKFDHFWPFFENPVVNPYPPGRENVQRKHLSKTGGKQPSKNGSFLTKKGVREGSFWPVSLWEGKKCSSQSSR